MSQKALKHFKKVDPTLYQAAMRLPEIPTFARRNSGDYFIDLCETIVGQQLSGKAASTIWGRFVTLFDTGKVTPETVAKLDIEEIKAVGTSRNKATYIKDLADKVLSGEVLLTNFEKMSDKEIVDSLVKIKGIGAWTAEMFLMFTLGREDIFSHGDLGLKNGIKKIYGITNPTKEDLEKISSVWSPHRSFASRILWKVLDTK